MKPHILASWLLLTTVGVAGVLKLVDIEDFFTTLGTWTLIPDAARRVITVAVPLFEIVVLAWFITGISRRACLASATGLVVCVTAAWVVQAVVAEPPDCGCFGAFDDVITLRTEAWWVLLRNAGLIALGVYAMGHTQASTGGPTRHWSNGMQKPGLTPAGPQPSEKL